MVPFVERTEATLRPGMRAAKMPPLARTTVLPSLRRVPRDPEARLPHRVVGRECCRPTGTPGPSTVVPMNFA